MSKIRQNYENSSYWRSKSSYLLNELMNFNEIFRKDLTYNNIKSHKNQGFSLSPKNTFLAKTTRGESNWVVKKDTTQHDVIFVPLLPGFSRKLLFPPVTTQFSQFRIWLTRKFIDMIQSLIKAISSFEMILW